MRVERPDGAAVTVPLGQQVQQAPGVEILGDKEIRQAHDAYAMAACIKQGVAVVCRERACDLDGGVLGVARKAPDGACGLVGVAQAVVLLEVFGALGAAKFFDVFGVRIAF